MEFYVEKTASPGRTLWGTCIGRYRAPFGLHNRSDHAYTGFLRVFGAGATFAFSVRMARVEKQVGELDNFA